MTAPDVPDWTRVVLLSGIDPSGNPITIAVDASGYIVAVMKGQYGTELKNIAVDGSGRLIMVPYGTTTVAGTATVTQVAKDREIQGSDGAGLHTIAVDVSGQMIMVPRGQSGKYMLVDADGYLTTVLKGIEGSTLRTVVVDSSGNIVAAVKGMYGTTPKDVAVDGSGRMIMIPTDPADVWGNAISMGNAELAACLTPAKRYDRRGNVIWLDSFEDGLLHIDPASSSAPITAQLSSARARTGSFCVKMACGVGASNFGALYHAVPYTGISRFGFEISFTVASGIDYISIVMAIDLDDAVYRGTVRWYPATEVLKYRDSAGNYQTFATGVGLSTDDRLFHTAKLVIGGSTYKYERFLLDDEEFDLSAYAQEYATGSWEPAIETGFRVYPTDGSSPVVYVDDWIITQNEPA